MAVLVAKLPLTLAVRTYDAAGVPPRELDGALQRARLVLAAAGVEPVWRPCHASLCPGAPKPHAEGLEPVREIVLRLVVAPGDSAAGSLGNAAVDVVEGAGTLATVYVNRVDALALDAGVDRGDLLGFAIAHEIGHLLLGTAAHAPYGLMRATWTWTEVRRAMPLDWRFTADEGEKMRRRLADAGPYVRVNVSSWTGE